MPRREQPLPDYYPTARVRLIVRLDDFSDRESPKPPKRPVPNRRGKKDSKTPGDLRVVEQDGRLLLLGPGDDPGSLGSPQQQTRSADKLTHVIDGIIPNTARHCQNGIRIADTLELTIQFKDLPLDPRVVRSCAVEYFLGCVSAEDYQRGINGELRADATSSGVPLPFHVVPDVYTDRHGRKRTNLRFQGWVDEWSDEWPEDDGPVVSLQCTDNTRLLIEQEAPAKLTVSGDQPIDKAIAEYLAAFPQFRGLAVEYRPKVPKSEVPVLKKVLARTAFQPKLGPQPSQGGTSKLMVWDYLTDIAGSIGHTLRFEGSSIIVQRARTLYAGQFPGRPDDPFTGRVLPSGRELSSRLYVYGDNVVEMKVGRKFTRYAPFNIEVRCYDSARKKTLVVRYPQKNDRVKRVNPGESGDQKYTVIRVAGIQDEKTLRVIAQGAYEALGRNELEMTFTTKALGSFGGDNLDPDALDVRATDPIEVEIRRDDPDTEGNSVNSIAREVANRPAEFLTGLGFSSEFAAAYARATSNVGFPTLFRVRTLTSDFSNDGGVTLDFECVNYVEVRSSKELPDGEELGFEVVDTEPVKVTVEDEVEG